MTEFIRVRAANGPTHEFDAPVGEVEANPDLYVVLDSEPVTSPRPAKYHDQTPSKSEKSDQTPPPPTKPKE